MVSHDLIAIDQFTVEVGNASPKLRMPGAEREEDSSAADEWLKIVPEALRVMRFENFEELSFSTGPFEKRAGRLLLRDA